MKLHARSIGVSTGLFMLLLLVLYMGIAVFISGPSRRYEAKIEAEEALILKQTPDVQDLQRHVFQYMVYAGEAGDTYVWFNAEGKQITSRPKDSARFTEVAQLAEAAYGLTDAQVSLGYGYEAPVYVITHKEREILLDYDTLEEVYDLWKGES